MTRLGDILKFMPANFLTIVDQIFGTFWANLETINVYVKTELASIWSTFDSFGLLLLRHLATLDPTDAVIE